MRKTTLTIVASKNTRKTEVMMNYFFLLYSTEIVGARVLLVNVVCLTSNRQRHIYSIFWRKSLTFLKNRKTIIFLFWVSAKGILRRKLLIVLFRTIWYFSIISKLRDLNNRAKITNFFLGQLYISIYISRYHVIIK